MRLSTDGGKPAALGPWMWSARTDLAVFGGSAAVALGLAALAEPLGMGRAGLPEWGWIAFVLAIDVAHVWSTLFRTYFDREELQRHRWRYALVPAGCYAAGVALYLSEPMLFWRVLAYLAVYHFVRQQVGWAAVYRSRARQGALGAAGDDGALDAAKRDPHLHWPAHLSETEFAWFVQGDFVALGGHAAAVLPAARVVWIAALVAFALRQVQVLVEDRTLHLGKLVVVASTAAIWWVGIVATNSDFTFTVTNVIVHGVPYIALLWAYARARRAEHPDGLGSQIAGWGLGAFVGVLLLLAFVEEMAWDRLVWHDRAWLFGSTVSVSTVALAWIVPLLSLPQTTHYVLDGMLWRRKDTRELPAQRRALGFATTP